MPVFVCFFVFLQFQTPLLAATLLPSHWYPCLDSNSCTMAVQPVQLGPNASSQKCQASSTAESKARSTYLNMMCTTEARERSSTCSQKMRMVVARSRKLASNRHSSKSAHLSYYSLPSIQNLGRKLTGIRGPRRQKRCHMYSPDLWGGVDRPVARLQSNRTSRAPVGHFTARSPVKRRRSPAE